MTEREALKLALEALETNNQAWKHLADSGDAGFWEAEEQPFYEISVKALTAIKEALSQPEQEPVATNKLYVTREQLAELYPPQLKPLTDEEIDRICGDVGYGYIAVARAIEAAHGIGGEA